jgi:hypothetical protein
LSYCSADHSDSSAYSTAVDFTTLSDCTTPGHPAASNIKQNSATMIWSKVLKASGYTLQIKAADSTQWISYSTGPGKNDININGLIANTIYEWQIRTKCNTTGDFSDYSAIQTFTTLPDPHQATNVDSAQKAPAMQVYPNPTGGNFDVQVNLNNREKITLTVTDMSGKVIMTQKYNSMPGNFNQTLNIGNLSPGVYFVTISYGSTVITQKITKQ